MRTLDRVLAPQVLLPQAIEDGINRAAMRKPLIVPCVVVSQSGWFVNVNLLIEVTKAIPTLENVPVLSSKHIYTPIETGDIGILVPADVFLDLAMASGSLADPTNPPSNLAGYMFLPLPKLTQTPADAESVCIDGPAGAFLLKASADGVSIENKAGTTKVDVGAADVTIQSGGRSVSMTQLWTFLTGFQTAYNANMTSLSLPTYPGTF